MPNILSRITQAVQESRDRFAKAVSDSRPVTTAKQYRDWWRERPGRTRRERRRDTPPQPPPYTPPFRPQDLPSRPSNRQPATPSAPRTRVVFVGSRRPWRRLFSIRNPWLVIALAIGIGYALVYRENPVLGRFLAQELWGWLLWIFQDIQHSPWLLLVVLGAWAIDHFLTGGMLIPRLILILLVWAAFEVPSRALALIPLILFVAGWVVQDIERYPWLIGILLIAVAIFAFLNKWRVRGKLGFLTRSTTLYGLLLFMLNPTAPQGVILDRLLWWPVWLVIAWLAWRVILILKAIGFRFFPTFG